MRTVVGGPSQVYLKVHVGVSSARPPDFFFNPSLRQMLHDYLPPTRNPSISISADMRIDQHAQFKFTNHRMIVHGSLHAPPSYNASRSTLELTQINKVYITYLKHITPKRN